jgi:hypothetical protein
LSLPPLSCRFSLSHSASFLLPLALPTLSRCATTGHRVLCRVRYEFLPRVWPPPWPPIAPLPALLRRFAGTPMRDGVYSLLMRLRAVRLELHQHPHITTFYFYGRGSCISSHRRNSHIRRGWLSCTMYAAAADAIALRVAVCVLPLRAASRSLDLRSADCSFFLVC